MKRKITKGICVFLSAVMVMAGVPQMTQINAESSKAKQAKKAYAKFLSNRDNIVMCNDLTEVDFDLFDLNRDGVPELVVTPDDDYHVYVYAYVNGKVKEVGYGFSGEEKYYPNKSIFYTITWHSGIESIYYYKFDGKEMKELASASIIRKTMKGAKERKIKWHKNTSANRKKYLGVKDTIKETTVTKLANGYYGAAKSLKKENCGKICGNVYRAKVENGKIYIWGSLAKVNESLEVVAKKKYAKYVFSLSKSCKIYDGSSYSYEIGELEACRLSKKRFNDVFGDKENFGYRFYIVVKNNKVVKIVCLS